MSQRYLRRSFHARYLYSPGLKAEMIVLYAKYPIVALGLTVQRLGQAMVYCIKALGRHFQRSGGRSCQPRGRHPASSVKQSQYVFVIFGLRDKISARGPKNRPRAKIMSRGLNIVARGTIISAHRAGF